MVAQSRQYTCCHQSLQSTSCLSTNSRDAQGLTSSGPEGWGEVYFRILRMSKSAYRVFFETLLANDEAIIFHCTVGKDRTGVAAALLLSLLGIPEEEIVRDYALTQIAQVPPPIHSQPLPRMIYLQ